jgi:hypothetical protein
MDPSSIPFELKKKGLLVEVLVEVPLQWLQECVMRALVYPCCSKHVLKLKAKQRFGNRHRRIYTLARVVLWYRWSEAVLWFD